MERWIDMRDQVKKTVEGSVRTFMEGVDFLVGKAKNELYCLKDKKDLYVKNHELRSLISGLGSVKEECYCAKGVIYRRDIHDVMHRVALINAECCKIRKDMASRRAHGG